MACNSGSCSGYNSSASGCSGGTCSASGYAGCYYACQGNAHGIGCVNSCTGCTGTCGASCYNGSTGSGGGGGGCSSCTGDCGGDCEGVCENTCNYDCYGDCEEVCENSCNNDCYGDCEGSCDTGCSNSCGSDCGSRCTGAAKTSIDNLKLHKYLRADNITEIYNAVIYEYNRRASTDKDNKTFLQGTLTKVNNINDILNNIPTDYSLNTTMNVGNKINQTLGNSIIAQIKEAWKEEL